MTICDAASLLEGVEQVVCGQDACGSAGGRSSGRRAAMSPLLEVLPGALTWAAESVTKQWGYVLWRLWGEGYVICSPDTRHKCGQMDVATDEAKIGKARFKVIRKFPITVETFLNMLKTSTGNVMSWVFISYVPCPINYGGEHLILYKNYIIDNFMKSNL